MLPRPTRRSIARERSPFSSPYSNVQDSPIAARRSSQEERRRPAANFDLLTSPEPRDRIEEEDEEEEEEDEGDEGDDQEPDEVDEEVILDDEDEDDDEDDAGEASPLLPIFSAAHLDSLPVYNLTHTLRLLIVPRCETTLSWDQLRSPQVSQFLVKPVQQQIRQSHFSKATLYALLANCLQFNKEIQTNPGNSGVSKTRSLVCELLAMKLLKEFSTRDLIDALSYDFDPLQGLAPASSGTLTPGPNWDPPSKAKPQSQSRAARVSTLEVAIRAQSKRFLAHPLVVQQLEAIWAGTIVFHSAADNLHRPPVKVTPNQNRGYGTRGTGLSMLRASPDDLQPAKQREHLPPTAFVVRRSATLYDPRDASLFKLSRLRVPRYRQFLSTCSFAVLLGLYIAVLFDRSLYITPLEVTFWFWSAGFMLDEVVGFNEQGFSLYILSFWNTFDVGILLLLVGYYCMRLYGILMPDVRKHATADMAYDILAADAVLLFPRLFSVLDHYRYFSQLLIAFRMMAEDLIAVFILIVISCSGFFVAFTLSFGDPETYDAPGVAYALFQILMGFTPAAWETWPKYNILGKVILTMFLFICHFLIVTILITVLTNSFMAIVQNANEEHQFVFAVNTISMVKSDALFSYVAPTNIISWTLAPLRFALAFRQYVKVNRTAIKATHFPVLFLIYAYERLILRHKFYDLVESVEQPSLKMTGLETSRAIPPSLRVLSPRPGRLREPSIATFRKDRALDEVFRRPFRDNNMKNARLSRDRRKASNVVNGWMRGIGSDGVASPPSEQDQSVIDRLEARRLAHRRSQLIMKRRYASRGRNMTEATLSVASDPEDFGPGSMRMLKPLRREESSLPPVSINEDSQLDLTSADNTAYIPEQSGAGLGQLATPLEGNLERKESQQEDYFHKTPRTSVQVAPNIVSEASVTPIRAPKRSSQAAKAAAKPFRQQHSRNLSSNTVLYDPDPEHVTTKPNRSKKGASLEHEAPEAEDSHPTVAGEKPLRRSPEGPSVRARPVMPPRHVFQSAPNLAGMLMLDPQENRRTPLAMDIGSDLGDNKAVGGGFIGAYPASFATQMAFGAGNPRFQQRSNQASIDDQQRMSKLMLARMNTLEEGFREVLKEVRQWKREPSADFEAKSADTVDLVEMKIGRRRSRNMPKPPWKGKAKAKAMGQENEWLDVDDGQEQEKREGSG